MIERFEKLYAASRQIMRAILHSQSRTDLLNAVARVMVEHGGFAMAVVAWHDSAHHRLMPLASFGDTKGYLDSIQMFTDERPEGLGAAGTAFRENTTCIINDFLSDPRTKPWSQAAQASGWRASAAIPFCVAGVPQGILGVYSMQPDSFGAEEQVMLEQVAQDMGFGLDNLEKDELRRQLQSSLAASELRLKLALEAGQIGIFDWDLRSGGVIWDGFSERMFGYQPGQFDGTYLGFESRLHPADVAELNRAAEEGRNTRTSLQRDFRVIWPDGTTRWLSSRGEFSYGESGAAVRMLGAMLDITARKQLEEATRRAEENLRHSLDGLLEGCTLLGFDWTFLYVNEEAARHGFKKPEDLIGKRMQDVYPTFDDAEVARRYRKCMRERTPQIFETSFTFPPQNIERWFELKVSPVPEGIFILSLEITERKRAEDEKNKLAAMVAMSRDFIGIASLDGQVLYLNPAALSMVGIETVDQARPKNITQFLPGQGSALAMQAALGAEGYWRGETTLRHFGGEAPIDVEVTAFIIRDDNGTPRYLATVTRDLRERRKTEAERAKLEAQLAQAARMESIGRLAGGVAHDFNNMLTVIMGYAAMLRRDFAPGSKGQQRLAEIEKAGERAKQITHQLLGFSRQQIIAPISTNLNDLVRDLLEPLGRLIGEDIELSFFAGPDLWPVLVDSSQVNQVLLNLVVNSRDAMPIGGKLAIETANARISGEYCQTHPDAHPGAFVVLTVTDTGVGISPEVLPKVFEPFFTTKGKDQGTGLGLSLVYGIVKQNGGFVNVYSEPGQGTAFRIYIPRLAGDPGAPEMGPIAGVRTGSGTVMVVEDDELVRKLVTSALELIGYSALVAASPAQAIELCAAESGSSIRAVLSDVVMPGMNGMELRERIWQVRPGVPVLFMSGYTSNVIGKQGILAPGVHFIQKPFTVDELSRRIEEVLTS